MKDEVVIETVMAKVKHVITNSMFRTMIQCQGKFDSLFSLNDDL